MIRKFILYILPEDENSHKAMGMVNREVDHVCNVSTLKEKKPNWLTGVPTLLVLSTKEVYEGTQCLMYMRKRNSTPQDKHIYPSYEELEAQDKIEKEKEAIEKEAIEKEAIEKEAEGEEEEKEEETAEEKEEEEAEEKEEEEEAEEKEAEGGVFFIEDVHENELPHVTMLANAPEDAVFTTSRLQEFQGLVD
jgi:flagellar biosynthesis GTPase FlhF